ncbi:hypothetical protein [Streptomyces sp. NPDC007117]|uniref:hypothetical protein n=1 Tax=Streptomyces sp. NPDC007117 TaxID=3154314 RepID=UPI00340529E1
MPDTTPDRPADQLHAADRRTTWPTAAPLQQAADLRRAAGDPLLADWLDATANALAWLAPYRDNEPGYGMWEAALAVARQLLGTTSEDGRCPVMTPGGRCEKDAQRAEAVTQFLGRLTDREHALIREAAVMGYIQGRRHPDDEEHPKDSAVLRLVIDAALTIPDLYPAAAAVEEQTTTTKLEYFLQTRDSDGTWGESSSFETDPERIVERLKRRRAQHPQREHRIAWRTTTVTSGPIPRIVPATPAPAAG